MAGGGGASVCTDMCTGATSACVHDAFGCDGRCVNSVCLCVLCVPRKDWEGV